MDSSRTLLRHGLATVAYRGGKTLRNAPPEYADFRVPPDVRTPVQILAHIGDLMDWGLSLAKGAQAWNDSEPLPWQQEVERFYAAVQRFDDFLASDTALGAPEERLFQGPVADALTHVGQLAMLRRLCGSAIRPENYYAARVEIGRVGPDQNPPKREF